MPRCWQLQPTLNNFMEVLVACNFLQSMMLRFSKKLLDSRAASLQYRSNNPKIQVIKGAITMRLVHLSWTPDVTSSVRAATHELRQEAATVKALEAGRDKSWPRLRNKIAGFVDREQDQHKHKS